MRRLTRAMVLSTLLASARCSDPNAPADVSNPPIDSASGRIAFVTERLGTGGFVYVANADGSGLRQLPGDQAHYMRPRWSPDGRRIAVARLEPGRLPPAFSSLTLTVNPASRSLIAKVQLHPLRSVRRMLLSGFR
jgi:dipeptidyl aminopeptidase/acylaminoacyl peptidase